VPHPLLRGGHVQTLAGAYLPGRSFPYRATQHQVPLADGDGLVLHDDCPPDWWPSAPTVLLIHGLGGSHASPYMRRLAGKFFQRGVRTFRMDLRGAGAGARLAKIPYHSGRSDDAAAAVRAIAALCPSSPTTIIGFSLGGNIALKLLGEIGASGCGNLVSGVVVSPPVELQTCCERIRQRDNRLYDRRFVRALLAEHRERIRLVAGAAPMPFTVEPKSLLELDDRFTGPINGYGNAENYYRQCSSSQFVPSIRLPTLIITAADDPMIPVEIFSRLELPENVRLHIAPSGGHLGFISHGQGDPDRRWMDWRILEWLTARQSELAIAE
jgi:predicted alpha/beta-fold hydrolase